MLVSAGVAFPDEATLGLTLDARPSHYGSAAAGR